MKKKLDAELISIAHRILKLKNRAELDVLQQETLKLYEKLTVLKFVEDNFSEVKPTIGYASAEAKLEEIYGIEEVPEVKANEVEADADKASAEEKAEPKQDKENTGGEGVDTDGDGKAPVAEEEKEATPEAEVPVEEEAEVAEPETEEPKAETTEEPTKEESNEEETPAEAPATEEATPVAEESKEDAPEEEVKEEKQPEQPEEDKENEGGEGVDTDGDDKAPIAEEEKAAQEVEEKEAEPAKEVKAAKIIVDAEVGLHPEEEVAITPEPEMPAIGTLPEKDGEDNDNDLGEGIDLPSGKPAVSEEEKEYTKGTDAGQTGFDFNFDKKLEDDFKPKQVSLEDFQNYKEPEFVKKDSPAKPAAETTDSTMDDWRNWEPAKSATTTAAPKADEPAEPKVDPTSLPLRDWRDWEPSKSETSKQPEATKPTEPVRDWRDWEPAKTPEPVAPVNPELPKPATVAAPAPTPAAPKFNDGFVRALSLGLNDRIAFEKNLFGGSSEDLNRVVSQLNTLNNFDEAKDFITDLVKPDYNNWAGKEEYEERFMQLVEKKFS